MRNASDKKPPSRASRNDVPIKFVTLLADFEGDICIYSFKYKTKLLAFAKYARFSNISTTTQDKKKIASKLVTRICTYY